LIPLFFADQGFGLTTSTGTVSPTSLPTPTGPTTPISPTSSGDPTSTSTPTDPFNPNTPIGPTGPTGPTSTPTSTPTDPFNPNGPTGDVIVLSGAEGRHASVVRRLRPGERVDVGDGAGLIAECVVTGPVAGAGSARTGRGGGGLELAVKALRRVPRPQPSITVIQAIPKGDRGELAVEEMTEVGVDRIVPWAAERSIPVWQPDAKGLARWRATAREAAKQSRRAWIPEVTASAGSAAEAARLVSAAAMAIVLDPVAARPLSSIDVPESGDLVLVVGPEGGITERESAEFAAAGATACRLGPTVLRASTAGAVTAAVLLSRTARWA
jgi:16S rRNA (uracil1498-N3)-methyltransferase